ncbi:hypothetical protein FGW37_11360 [Streptomyces rectiverticillatus]|nr:hypothetical protein FGW37_11360 [Streptomyces rectiverticillatus]
MQRCAEALLNLGSSAPDLARTLALLVETIALEAVRTGRFSSALSKVLAAAASSAHETGAERSKGRSRRRAKGLIDPFEVFAELGGDGLRARLGALDLEQLRDIVAEHGMDHDRLAMKWKDPQRVMERIVERVEARTAKGSAFREPTRGSTPPHD